MDASDTPERLRLYWKANLGVLLGCLIVWFLCSYGAGILFVETMNRVRVGGVPLGFWFAQQGSIYVFVALIFFYAWYMNRIERALDVHEE